jgi:hypothetical protein
MNRLGRLLALTAALIGLADPSAATEWKPFVNVPEPRDTAMSLHIGGDTAYAVDSAWVRAGRTTDGLRDLSSTRFFLLDDGLFGVLQVLDGLERTWFNSVRPTDYLKDSVAYWKSIDVRPLAEGSFYLRNANLRWIAYTHTDDAQRQYACAAISANGRPAQFSLVGFWCAEGARQMTEADVQSLVDAIGYKNILFPRPMAKLPWR